MLYHVNTLPSPPDQRDIIFVSRTGAVIAPSLDLLPEVYEIEDQKQVGSCVANGIVEECESRLKVAGRPLALSRMALYTMTLNDEHRLGQEGLVTRDALQAGYKYGLCHEDAYPYDPAVSAVNPPAEIYAAAAATRIRRYEAVVRPFYDLGEERQWKVDRILSALNEGLSVGIGMQVSASLRNLTGPWQTHRYETVSGTAPSIGGHFMVIVGYSQSLGLFLVQNSWGATWGDGGFGGLPFAIVDDPFFEAWIIRDFDGCEIPEQPGIKLEIINRFSISCRIVPLPSEQGTTVRVWVGALLNGVWMLKQPGDVWIMYDGISLPSCDMVALGSDNLVAVVKWLDLTPYSGAEVYVAYGQSPLDWTIAKICTVPIFQ